MKNTPLVSSYDFKILREDLGYFLSSPSSIAAKYLQSNFIDDSSTFDQHPGFGRKYQFILFGNKLCPYSNKMVQNLKESFKLHNSEVSDLLSIFVIRCELAKSLCKHISYYPYVKLSIRGIASSLFSGDRSPENLAKYFNEIAVEVSQVKKFEEFDKADPSGRSSMVLLFAKNEQSSLLKTFKKASTMFPNRFCKLFYVLNSNHPEQLYLKNINSGTSSDISVERDISADKMITKILNASDSLFLDITNSEKTLHDLLHTHSKSLTILFYDANDQETTDKILDRFKKILSNPRYSEVLDYTLFFKVDLASYNGVATVYLPAKINDVLPVLMLTTTDHFFGPLKIDLNDLSNDDDLVAKKLISEIKTSIKDPHHLITPFFGTVSKTKSPAIKNTSKKSNKIKIEGLKDESGSAKSPFTSSKFDL